MWFLNSLCNGLLSSYFWGLVSIFGRGVSICDVLVVSFLFVVRETSQILVRASSVIVASHSSHVSAKDSVVPL